MRPAPTLPVGPCGRVGPPPAPAGAIFMHAPTATATPCTAPTRRPRHPDGERDAAAPATATNRPRPPTAPATPRRPPRPRGPPTAAAAPRRGDRESELAPAGYTCTVRYGRTYRACRTTQ